MTWFGITIFAFAVAGWAAQRRAERIDRTYTADGELRHPPAGSTQHVQSLRKAGAL